MWAAVAELLLEGANVTGYTQRYACVDCGESKMLPEHPRHGQRSIRTGCASCEAIRRHTADGRAAGVFRGP